MLISALIASDLIIGTVKPSSPEAPVESEIIESLIACTISSWNSPSPSTAAIDARASSAQTCEILS